MFIFCAVRILSCALFLGTTAAQAATYYVDVNTGKDENTGASIEEAWQHLPGTVDVTGTGWTVLRDGDSVVVKGGTLNKVQVAVTSDYYQGEARYHSIQILGGHLATPAWGRGRPVFDGEIERTFGFHLGGNKEVQGVTLDGFEIQNLKPGGVGDGFDPDNGNSCVVVGGNKPATYCSVRRSWLHHSLRNANDRGHGIETGGGDHLLVEFNTVGPTIGTKGIEIYHTDWSILRNNYVYNVGDHGIVITGNRCDVYNNIVEMAPPYVHEHVKAMKVYVEGSDIWNNVFFQRDLLPLEPGANRAQGVVFVGVKKARFYHNTIYGFGRTEAGGENGVGLVVGSERKGSEDIDLQNNLVCDSENGEGGIQLFLQDGNKNTILRWNDFFYRSPDEKVVTLNGAFYTVAEFQPGLIVNGGAFEGNVQAAPGFRMGAMPNGLDGRCGLSSQYFHLTAESPEAVRATNNPLRGGGECGCRPEEDKFSRDMLGRPRAAWSMGAFEWSE
ncbi:MAG: right-handed parallel beta-helix repeat-containing protein [Planctomycetota bacterium]